MLVHPPEDYKLRDVKDVWVEKIKEAMSLYPSRPLTRIPVLVRPEEVNHLQFVFVDIFFGLAVS